MTSAETRAPAPRPPLAPDARAPAAVLAAALESARWAPSILNTQPWWFRPRDGHVEVHADRARALAAIDPDGRELAMSCGAAVFHLCVAIRHLGRAAEVRLLPQADDPDHLADVAVGALAPASPEMDALFAAIPRRRTNRGFYPGRRIPAEVMAALRGAAELEGARLVEVADADARGTVIDLVAEGDARLFADPRYCRDLAAWLRPTTGGGRDGISASAVPIGSVSTPASPPGGGHAFDIGRWQAQRDRMLAESAPALVVLVTSGNAARDWLTAGLALDRVLLRAAAAGVTASFLHQPLQVADLRPRLRDALGTLGCVQAVLRLGFGPEAAPTPRRPLAELVR